MAQEKETLIPREAKNILREDFKQLREPVTVAVFTDDRDNKPFNEFTLGLVSELAGLADKIRPVLEPLGGDLAKKYDVSRTPTVLLAPEKYAIRYTGAPAGEEARTFVMAILMASTGNTVFSDASRERLSGLAEKRNLKVFVSPTCPYCPQQAALAISAAIEKPGLVSSEIIEIYENKDLAAKYDAFSVPQVFIDDRLVGLGLQPEEVFVEEVLTAAAIKPKPVEPSGRVETDLLIIGAGPAGLTAAIYASRSGLKSHVVEKANIGGQVSITPIVENYPGFTRIGGRTLMDMMAQQAINYADIREGEGVLEISRKDDVFEAKTARTTYIAKAVLIATGADSRKLGAPGEAEFQGRGVSYCAACDGYFFKDGKKVIVVGGGNTAATEALYLKNIGVEVTLVHRRGQLRAEKFLEQSLKDNGIPVMWNTVVREIVGEKTVKGVVIEDANDGSRKTMPVDGVFIAIGYVPNNEIARKLGVETDEEGYVKVTPAYRTNVKGVYAAGDITGGLKQIVTAVGQGATAATTIFEDLASPYWKEKGQSQ